MTPMLLALALALLAPPPPSGTLLSREPLTTAVGYEAWLQRAYGSPSGEPPDPPPDLARARRYFTPALFAGLSKPTDVTVERITYASDGLKVAGLMARPTHPRGRLPVILWCRGGVGLEGGLTLGDAMIMSNWVRRGYVVLASNYRGGPRSEGRDEDGGDDVHDVAALAPLARALPFADAERLFLYGYSRGGMMVYRAIAEGLAVRAAAVNSGVSDAAGFSGRPDAADMEALSKAAMPDYAEEKASGFARRSAIRWPQKLTAPLLILHGTADWRVAPAQPLALATRLQALGAPYTLHMFSGGAHVALDGEQARLDAEVLEFFASNGGAANPAISSRRGLDQDRRSGRRAPCVPTTGVADNGSCRADH